MGKPRVFISHSAKEDEAETLLDKLYEKLTAADYPVLLDKMRLESGKPWRPTLNYGIGGCEAAVILISEAALESNWVAYETSLLAYRRHLEPDFGLFPVVLSNVNSAKIKASPLSPSAVTEIQGTKLRDKTVDELVDEVFAALEEHAELHHSRTHMVRYYGAYANRARKLYRSEDGEGRVQGVDPEPASASQANWARLLR